MGVKASCGSLGTDYYVASVVRFCVLDLLLLLEAWTQLCNLRVVVLRNGPLVVRLGWEHSVMGLLVLEIVVGTS